MAAASDLSSLLLQAFAVTVLAAVVAVPLGVVLSWLAAPWAAALASLVLLAAVMPLGDAAAPAGMLPLPVIAALPVVPWVTLPLAWALRRVPVAAPRIAATLGGPALVLWRLWLPAIAPGLLAGLAAGFARALAGSGLAWPAALLLAAAAWPMLRALASRDG